MTITILTLFPEMFQGFLENSIIKRAIAKGVVAVKLVNIRDYTKDKYGRVDTPPIGGGAGLIMKCQPLVDALLANKKDSSRVLLMSPRGKTFNQKMAHDLAHSDDLILVCGHYEGIDERFHPYVDELVSIGDYILTGGEIPSMAISDAVIRLLDGAIANESTFEETFENGLLEYPQYTEPYDFKGQKVPDILYSGNHGAIAKWRQKQSLVLTRQFRPDLFRAHPLTKTDVKLLKEVDEGTIGSWETDALAKGHKFIKSEE